MALYLCSMCSFSTGVYDRYFSHLVRRHRNESNFIVNCCFDNCMYSSKSWNAFKIHVSRRHPDKVRVDGFRDSLHVVDNDDDMETGELHSLPERDRRTLSFAAFLLKMECEHKMSQRALNDLAHCTADLVAEHMQIYRDELQQNLAGSGTELSLPHNDFETNCFLTTHARRKFYSDNCGLIACEEIKLGDKNVRHKGRLVKRKLCGYIVPLTKTLEALLNMPEVWNYVVNPHNTSTELMSDICDGTFVQSNVLFQTNPQALQLIMSCDDVEIANPLGAHVKKHKVCMFYLTLANIPPQFRSKLCAIQLIGVAKSQHLRNHNALKMFLADFVATVKQLRSNGIEVVINGVPCQIHGDLILCPCDTLASQWLGGFKEGVSFALKGCRTCTANSSAMKTVFDANKFQTRQMKQHEDRCQILSSHTEPKVKKYWSKLWGINFRSPLMDIDNNINLPLILVHDPMHILMEGLIPYELPLILFHLIHDLHLFTLNWLNSQIAGYPYSYLDAGSKPESINNADIVTRSKIKQTSAAMLTLIYVLPHILGNKIPESDVHWCNFLRLIQIVHLATSPYATIDTVGQLDQLIMSHHHCFVELYPRANIVPKMHYCLHLPRQILLFGPLRSQWCMRFEAKHGLFKSFKWKCFKNIPKSLAEKHQLWMCSKMFSFGDKQSRTFLYAGDIVSDGSDLLFEVVYANLVSKFTALLTSYKIDVVFPLTVYDSPEVTIHGHVYRAGSVLLLSWANDWPKFAVIERILIVAQHKFFVIDVLQTVSFEQNFNSYAVKSCGEIDIISFMHLVNVWPLPMFVANDNLFVVNRYAHFVHYIS